MKIQDACVMTMIEKLQKFQISSTLNPQFICFNCFISSGAFREVRGEVEREILDRKVLNIFMLWRFPTHINSKSSSFLSHTNIFLSSPSSAWLTRYEQKSLEGTQTDECYQLPFHLFIWNIFFHQTYAIMKPAHSGLDTRARHIFFCAICIHFIRLELS